MDNEAVREISMADFEGPRISVDRIGGKVHLFFGTTARAQLSIEMRNSLAIMPCEVLQLRGTFPNAVVEFQ